MISGCCPVICCISIALPLTILKYKYFVSVVAFEAKKKRTSIFLPETTVRHRNTLHKAVHLCLIVREMLEILLTHSDSLSSLQQCT